MANQIPRFFSTPFRYLRWASIEKPALLYSCVIGSIGPIAIFVVPPMRRAIGDTNPAPIPMTYPIPTGPRKKLTGYDD